LAIVGLLSPLFLGGLYLMEPFLDIWVGDQLGDGAPWVGRIVLVAMWANALALVSFTRLQATGRPDLVTKIMLCEIPPYLGLLAALTHAFGLVGAALATASRSIADYLLLTWAARTGYPAFRSIVLNFGLLVAGVICAGAWRPSDWEWWASATLLCGASFAIALWTVPPEIGDRLLARFRLRWPLRGARS
jgi:O-antigen/teichoic acid export membrane protein